MEQVDALLPVLVALYHDAGKFHEGGYHKDEVPEEEHAAILAGRMLAEAGAEPADIEAVRTALRALYDDRLPCVEACRIVQDADRLDKLGALGVAAFSPRQRCADAASPTRWCTRSAGVSYALAAPHSMLTETGKRLAGEQTARPSLSSTNF